MVTNYDWLRRIELRDPQVGSKVELHLRAAGKDLGQPIDRVDGPVHRRADPADSLVDAGVLLPQVRPVPDRLVVEDPVAQLPDLVEPVVGRVPLDPLAVGDTCRRRANWLGCQMGRRRDRGRPPGDPAIGTGTGRSRTA